MCVGEGGGGGHCLGCCGYYIFAIQVASDILLLLPIMFIYSA